MKNVQKNTKWRKNFKKTHKIAKTKKKIKDKKKKRNFFNSIKMIEFSFIVIIVIIQYMCERIDK